MNKYYKLTDFSFLKDATFKNVCGYTIFKGTPAMGANTTVKLVVKDLKLRTIWNDTIYYLDCIIEYKGKVYFTKFNYLKNLNRRYYHV